MSQVGKEWIYLFLLLWLAYLFISGILLFSSGFLLSREVIFQRSTCISSLDIFCDSYTHNLYAKHGKVLENDTFSPISVCSLNNFNMEGSFDNALGSDKNCLPSKTRVLLIIIDALKYDFAHYNENFADIDLKPYQNKLTVLQNMLKTRNNNSRLYKFIADPPTTTMQRLKGLTTGSLPTFIDIGSNFASSEIDEDNIIDQIVSLKKNVVFMGDDTWTSLYPKRFIREYAYPSFDVWDLDTVDNGIKRHLFSEIQKNDWSLLIAHFLGVDHCGHRYGPDHPEMGRKLGEMNEVIRNVLNKVDNNTVVIVIGDHGMTTTGDHGGESESEVTSAMFVYSPHPLLVDDSSDRVVSQVDLVPTLATILGIPIPFSNLGGVILDALPAFSSISVQDKDWNFVLRAVWNNVDQTTNYIHQYSTKHSKQFSQDKIHALNESYVHLKKSLLDISSVEEIKKFIHECRIYINVIRKMCQDVWVEFNFPVMMLGLALVFISSFVSFALLSYVQKNDFEDILDTKKSNRMFFVIFSFSITTSVFAGLYLVDVVQVNYVYATLIMLMFLFAVLLKHWCSLNKQWLTKHFWFNPINSCSVVVFLCNNFSFFSNSYVVEEAKVLSYFLITILFIHFYNYEGVKDKKVTPKGKSCDKSVFEQVKFYFTSVKLKCAAFVFCTTVVIRLSHYYLVCREDHGSCESLVSRKPQGSGSIHNEFECLITLVFLGVLVTAVRIWLRACGNLVGFSPIVTLARYAPTVLVVCTGGFWVLQNLPTDTRDKLILPWHLNILPWVIYFIVIVTYLCLFVQPLCVFTLLNKSNNFVLPVYGQGNVIPRLYKQVKELISAKSDSSDDTPVVYGLATAYSAALVVAVLFTTLLASLLLGVIFAQALVLMIICSVCLCAILMIYHHCNSSYSGRMFFSPWQSVQCWVLLTAYFFYATGHQATFPAIHWEASIIGTSGVWFSNYISGVLVVINTFAAYIIAGLGLPSLLILPYTLKVMFPKLVPVKSKAGDQADEAKKGELIIFQKDGLFYDGLFDLCLKYIVLFALRVLGSMVSATIHCRHLMVWSIFAPKFIFESLAFFITVPSVIIGYILVVRVTHQLDNLVTHLGKELS